MAKPVSLCVPLLSMVALLHVGATQAGSIAHAAATQPFPEAELFFELNDTDHDLGIHASIDGGPWETLAIEGPNGRPLLSILARGPLQRQGMTQLFFESAEPSFDELDPALFFRRFPEGTYEIAARLQGGGELESVAELSHVLPAPPGNILVSGLPAAENCDADPLPEVVAPVVIRWDPVTASHPDVGESGRVQIVRYQFFVEIPGTKLSLDLPPTVTEFEVPAAMTPSAGQYKFEIIARGATGNNTAVESCFRVK